MADELLNTLENTPKIIERILRVFPHDRIDDRIEPDRFTAREVVAHLADLEQTVLDKIRLAHLKAGSKVEAWYDPDVQAKEHHFDSKDVFHEAEVFESRRAMTLDYLRNLKQEELSNCFVDPDGNDVSIVNYGHSIVAHDIEHIEQLSRYLATEVATIG